MEYRTNFFLDLFSGVFSLMIQIYLWTVIFQNSSSETIYGYNYNQLIMYTVMAGIVSKLLSTGFENMIASDIKDGGLSKFLVQPINYFYFRFFCFFGQKICQLLFLVITLIIILFVNRYLFHFNLEAIFLTNAIIPIILAVLLNFLIFFSVSTIAFWMLDVSMLLWGFNLLTLILSGAIFPLDIFGNSLMMAMGYLPFKYTTYFTLDVLTGKIGGQAISAGITIQLIWIFIFIFLSSALWRIGMKRYVAVGG